MDDLLFQKGRYFKSEDSPYKSHLEKKRWEVFFRHVFTAVKPHQEVPPGFECPGNIAIKVQQLSHITHQFLAAEIDSEECYVFKAFKKNGKAYKNDGSPLGESFLDQFLSPGDQQVSLLPDEQTYVKVQWNESLMPQGYYSWWGVCVLEYSIDTPARKVMIENFQKDVSRSSLCPDYFRIPPSSRYGSIEFTGELHNLLKYYRNSRVSLRENNPDVYLLLGGTLRYRREICCVVIICTGEDKLSDALKQYRPIPLYDSVLDSKDPVLLLNGLVNNEGKVIDYSGECSLTFYPRYLVKNEAWAKLAFGFYYSDDSSRSISCAKSDIKHCPVQHTKCIRTQPPPRLVRHGRWLCPDVIADRLANLC